jgi:hypothetical protein
MKVSHGYCQCGCGEKAPIAAVTSKKRGHIKGEPIRFINGHQFKRGAFLARRNGVFKTYPCQTGTLNKREHVAIAEKALGKPLPPGAVVHHANGTKNGGELVICQDQSYHLLLHSRMRALAASGHVGWLKCPFCKKYDDPKNLYTKGKNNHYHRGCCNEDKRNRREKCANTTTLK